MVTNRQDGSAAHVHPGATEQQVNSLHKVGYAGSPQYASGRMVNRANMMPVRTAKLANIMVPDSTLRGPNIILWPRPRRNKK